MALEEEEKLTAENLTLCPICWPPMKKNMKIGDKVLAPTLMIAKGDKEGYCAVCKRSWSELKQRMKDKGC